MKKMEEKKEKKMEKMRKKKSVEVNDAAFGYATLRERSTTCHFAAVCPLRALQLVALAEVNLIVSILPRLLQCTTDTDSSTDCPLAAVCHTQLVALAYGRFVKHRNSLLVTTLSTGCRL